MLIWTILLLSSLIYIDASNSVDHHMFVVLLSYENHVSLFFLFLKKE